MKHFKILILAISFLTVFNCSKDDDSVAFIPERSIQEKIAYRWNIVAVEDPNSGIQLPLTTCVKRTYYQFSLNGEAQVEFFNEDDDDNCISDGVLNGTYILLQVDGENGVKIITDSGDETSKIISITETELILEQQGFGIRHLIFTRA
ncbi:lipocalin-like domain-containing protein [Bizionia psychrotolerans]|uniref:lipocalin family protein n=1 Tax=Bizionia psychrotolerans TaxID=1492901 RepID=UPI0006518702|nr:lipocalin family protein [Bizionia psychrotolerans]